MKQSDYKEVFRKFYDDNESGGSSRWLVTPDTVERFIDGLLYSRTSRLLSELEGRKLDELDYIKKDGQYFGEEKTQGYNQAIQEAQDLIKRFI